jgi:hypothetical protein
MATASSLDSEQAFTNFVKCFKYPNRHFFPAFSQGSASLIVSFEAEPLKAAA